MGTQKKDGESLQKELFRLGIWFETGEIEGKLRAVGELGIILMILSSKLQGTEVKEK